MEKKISVLILRILKEADFHPVTIFLETTMFFDRVSECFYIEIYIYLSMFILVNILKHIGTPRKSKILRYGD